MLRQACAKFSIQLQYTCTLDVGFSRAQSTTTLLLRAVLRCSDQQCGCRGLHCRPIIAYQSLSNYSAGHSPVLYSEPGTTERCFVGMPRTRQQRHPPSIYHCTHYSSITPSFFCSRLKGTFPQILPTVDFLEVSSSPMAVISQWSLTSWPSKTSTLVTRNIVANVYLDQRSCNRLDYAEHLLGRRTARHNWSEVVGYSAPWHVESSRWHEPEFASRRRR